MISFKAKLMANFLCKNEIIKAKDKEVYSYGFELIISSVIGFLIIILLGIVFNKLQITLSFFFVFITTRTYTGGYHADSYLKCNLIFSSLILITLFLTYVINNYNTLDCQIIFSLVYLITIFHFGVTDNESKKIKDIEKAKFKKRSIIIGIVWILIAVFISFYNKEITITITLTLFIVALLIVIEKIKRKEMRI